MLPRGLSLDAQMAEVAQQHAAEPAGVASPPLSYPAFARATSAGAPAQPGGMCSKRVQGVGPMRQSLSCAAQSGMMEACGCCQAYYVMLSSGAAASYERLTACAGS